MKSSKVIEYQINQHDEYGDRIDCDHRSNKAQAMKVYQDWLDAMPTSDYVSVSVERVVSHWPANGEFKPREFETIIDSAEE